VEMSQVHWIVEKHVLSYLRGIVEYGLRYLGGDEVELHGYIDSDWAGCVVDRKSTSRCCFNLGSIVIIWLNMKPIFIALILVEA
jgi:hypothetical protein